jgi:endo-1,4-beta-xylanase
MSITITANQTGTHGGYDYELWKDNGTTSMTLKDGGSFSCSWSNINNALFRKGKKYNETQTYQQLGNIVMNYTCNYNPNGNSYLSVYGWTSSPLVEYYIIESYGTWKPPGSNSPKATITVDGGSYEIYETTRTNQPSIKGTATFQQYWSVRTAKRTSGTISVSEHFKAWEARGMKMGLMYEVSLVVEGYQSSGTADVTSMSITVGGTSPSPSPSPKTSPKTSPSPSPSPKTSPKTSQSPSPSPSPSGPCAKLYNQCGGVYYKGVTCCTEGTCQYKNDYYSQCLK